MDNSRSYLMRGLFPLVFHVLDALLFKLTRFFYLFFDKTISILINSYLF